MEKLVHVVPLGWEVDRAVLPVVQMHAHLVYLLCNPASHKNQKYCFDRVRAALEKKGIRVKHIKVDANSDLIGVMREVAKVVQSERAKGNRIYLNMSAAGKIASLGASLAAMAHLGASGGVIYYVTPEEYIHTKAGVQKHGLTRGMDGDARTLPFFELKLPDQEGRLVLKALNSSPDATLGYYELIQALRAGRAPGWEDAKYEPSTPRSERNKLNVRLNKRVLQKLLREGYIEIETRGRKRAARLTEYGVYLANLCSAPE